MPDRFYVTCPGCGDEKGSSSTAMVRAGRSCDCGTDFTIDPETQEVEVIETDGGDPHQNGHR